MPHRTGRLAGTSSAGSGIAGVADMSIPLIQSELLDDYAIKLSDDAIAKYIRRYQVMLAARQQDPQALRRHTNRSMRSCCQSTGCNPRRDTRPRCREGTRPRTRVWFAKPLISATADEVQRLIAQAKEWATSLNKTVSLWISDKQDAFVMGIAAEFPGVPHRYCDNHFLRDLAKPVLEADSHAKVQMRHKGCAGCGKSNKPCSNGRMPRRRQASHRTIRQQL